MFKWKVAHVVNTVLHDINNISADVLNKAWCQYADSKCVGLWVKQKRLSDGSIFYKSYWLTSCDSISMIFWHVAQGFGFGWLVVRKHTLWALWKKNSLWCYF